MQLGQSADLGSSAFERSLGGGEEIVSILALPA
jgi:hypothetical protein